MVARMVEISDRLYVSKVRELLGEEGVAGLRRLLAGIRTFYKWVPCEKLTGGVTIYVHLSDEFPSGVDDFTLLDPSRFGYIDFQQATIHVEKDGQLRLWPEFVDPFLLPEGSIGYHFRYIERPGTSVEHIQVRNEAFPVLNASGFPSAFAVPSFDDLGAALEQFEHMVDSPDPHLETVWRSEKRLAFLPKPERHMRRSLELYLRHSLRDARILVRPEQNVNETEPVDLEISWAFQGRMAWIEIKWLGHSGPLGSDRWSTSYHQGRAVEGAHQLANYLDSGAQRISLPLMGYIVVFDARRRDLSAIDTSISRENGMYYQLRDIVYPPEILARPDMAKPVRYFLKPLCDAVLDS